MTFRTSLFNFGIFKNTVNRFKWGSILYFVILFFSLPFILLVEDLDRLVSRYAVDLVSPILLRGDYIVIPVLLAIVVPTVVAVLVFNNVHSQKQGIFVHSLPVARKANYVSSVLAGLVLMAVPVILTAAILLVMSFTAYGQIISSWSVIYWTLLNLSILFIMFSAAVFTAFLTGNAAAHIGINVFVHLIPMIVALIIFLISDIFLFGFMQADGFVGNKIMENTPIVWLFGKTLSHYRSDLNMFKSINMWMYLLGAAVVYALGYLVYKKRKIENCGDVAAFKIFRPILKYAVTSAVATVAFAIFTESGIGAVPVFIIAIVATAITYFAVEILMNKSFKVFGAYKGYLAFLGVCAAFIAFFAFTNVFGYETKVPKAEEVESAAVFVRWNDEPHVADNGLINATIAIHQELIENIPVVCEPEQFRHLRVSYKLKNGKNIERVYKVTEDVEDKALAEMYKFDEYKMKVTRFDNLNIENITRCTLVTGTNSFGYDIQITDDASTLMNFIKKDLEELSYEQIKKSKNTLSFCVDFSYSFLENEKAKVFKEFYNYNEDTQYALQSFSIDINSNFKNAYAFLKEKGYYSKVVDELAHKLSICKKTISRAGEIYSYKGETGDFGEFQINPADCIRIEFDDAVRLADTMANEVHRDVKEGQNYFVFVRPSSSSGNIWLGEMCTTIHQDELPEYLKKYVE